MSNPLHLNLLEESEYVSSSPIRLRVMMPMFALLTALGTGVWWSIIAMRVHALAIEIKEAEGIIAQLKPSHDRVMALRAEEKEIEGNLKQISFYQNARITFGQTLEKIADQAPAKLQLTELNIPPPPEELAAPDPKKPWFGPTNTVELVMLRLAGRTTGSKQVEALLKTFQTSSFTNLIRASEIPKGAYRQDTTHRGSNLETLLFELTCDCAPRRFE